MSRGGWLNSDSLHLALLLAIPVVLALLPVEWIDGDGPPLCVFKNITGHDCPGCGITRSAVSLMHLDFGRAWAYNPLIVIIFPIAAWLWMGQLRRTVRNLRRTRETSQKAGNTAKGDTEKRDTEKRDTEKRRYGKNRSI